MQKHIILIDFTLSGHHYSFLCSFSKILLQHGHRVTCLVPQSGRIENYIQDQMPEKVDVFTGFEYEYIPEQFNKLGHFSATASVLHQWKTEAKMIRQIEKKMGISADLIFYAWLDSNLSVFIPAWLIDLLFPWKWSGLYFHPYHLRQSETNLKNKANWRDQDSIFLAKKCIGVAVHDSGIINAFSQRINKPVLHFPETADDSLPNENYPLAQKIRELAKGRLVIGMIGCEPHKGTLNLMRAVGKANPDKYFFAFMGIFNPAGFPENEQQEVNDFVNTAPENCFFHFKPIPEGSAYNAVFSSFDIPYLVYNNFISSSNRLTKAAIFERLVLAQNNYCVGADVTAFDLGEAITPNNPEKAVEGLDKLSERIANKNFPFEQWKQYRELNSMEKLGQRFKELLGLIS